VIDTSAKINGKMTFQNTILPSLCKYTLKEVSYVREKSWLFAAIAVERRGEERRGGKERRGGYYYIM